MEHRHRQPAGAPMRADTAPVGDVYGLAFSPNGGLLATADSDDHGGTVQLWNMATRQRFGAALEVDPEPNGIVYRVAFSAHGALVATAESGPDGDKMRL